MSKNGFTIIELIVTIAITAVILSIGITSYSRSLISSRNTRREVDAQKIRSALERYRSEDPNNVYPNTIALITPYIAAIPEDPATNVAYPLASWYTPSSCVTYAAQSMCNSYQFYIPLEPASSNNYIFANPEGHRVVTGIPPAPTAIPTISL